MRVALSILGTEVIAIDTARNNDNHGPADCTTNPMPVGFYVDKYDEHRQTP